MEPGIINTLLTPTALLLTALGLQVTGVLLCWLVADALAAFDARSEHPSDRAASRPVEEAATYAVALEAIRVEPARVRALVVPLIGAPRARRRADVSAMIDRNAA